jgi:hypothetical protein
LDASFDLESSLPDEEMDADGDFDNMKVREKKIYPPLRLPPPPQGVKHQRADLEKQANLKTMFVLSFFQMCTSNVCIFSFCLRFPLSKQEKGLCKKIY